MFKCRSIGCLESIYIRRMRILLELFSRCDGRTTRDYFLRCQCTLLDALVPRERCSSYYPVAILLDERFPEGERAKNEIRAEQTRLRGHVNTIQLRDIILRPESNRGNRHVKIISIPFRLRTLGDPTRSAHARTHIHTRP